MVGGNDVSIFNEAYTNFDIFTGAFTTLNVMGNHSQNVEIGFEIINTDGTIYRILLQSIKYGNSRCCSATSKRINQRYRG